MLIKKVDSMDKYTIDEIVKIHLATFEGFFLTFMGRGFLFEMYKSYILHNDSDILIAEDDGKILGFLAYSKNMSGLYKYMIKHSLIPFAWYSFLAFLRKPKVFMHLISAFLKPSEASREENYVELSSIGVSPKIKSKGTGSLLIDELKKIIDFNKYEYIKLETDALNNELANHFYIKNGFKLVREYETSEGRKMNEYHYYGGNENENFVSWRLF